MDIVVSGQLNEQKLQSDLGFLIKRVKHRQEEHRRFFEYNNKVHARWSQIADEIFIHDELSKLKNYIHEKLSFQESQQQLDLQICTRYEHVYSCTDSIVLLMKRVAARVIEIAQNGLQSLKETIQYYTLAFNRFKIACLRASNDPISSRPSNMIKIFSKFIRHKMVVEADRLREIANFLEMSDNKSLIGLKEAYYQKLYKKELLNRQFIVKESIERSESNSNVSGKIIKKEVSMHSQKQIRIKLSKHNEKQRDKARKFEIKRIKKYIQSLCDVMSVNKEQMLEDIFIGNKQSESRRIYTQLTGRNRHNLSQILAYIDKNPEIKEIPPPKQEVLQVKYLQAELIFEKKHSPVKNKIQDAYNIAVRISKSPIKNDNESNPRHTKHNSFNTKSRSIYKRCRYAANNEEQAQNQKQKEVFQTQRPLASQFVQINIKNQQQKQHFPEIFSRATSVDTVKVLKKQAQLKYLKQQKLMRDHHNNREKIRGSFESSNQTFASKKNLIENNDAVVSSSNFDKLKGRQKIETKIRLELKTMGSNFFQEIGKKISKFCQMKKNLVA